MTTYQYSSLERLHIRLLVLQPGKQDDALSGFLISSLFDPKTNAVPDFETLSYTWGDQSNPKLIELIDGGALPTTGAKRKRTPASGAISKALGTVAIGRNLAAALQRLRYDDQPRVLWCDSICINQGDLAERAAQVLRMGDIYTKTRRVIVWLGPEADDSSLAMTTLGYTGSQIDSSQAELDASTNMVTFIEGADPRYKGQGQELPFTQQQWTAIAKLLARSWFKRLWIRQEITLANPTAIVVTGKEEILWSQLVGAAACIRSKESLQALKTPDSMEFRRDLTNLASFRRMKVVKGLHGILDYTRQCECTDDRDRVYALLGLISQELGEAIKPDYTQSVKQVYRSMAIEYFRHHESMSLLEYCDSPTSPTWVPDLQRLGKSLGHFEHTWASGDSKGPLKMPSGDELEVWGVRCDSITYLVKSIPEGSSEGELKQAVTDAAVRFLGPSPEVWSNEKLEMVVQALLGGRSFEIAEWINYPRLASSVSVLKKWATKGSVAPGSLIGEGRVLAAFQEILPGRSLYGTTKGSFVTGPSGCKQNDLVVTLLGCRTTMIIRPTRLQSQTTNAYHVIGPAYHPNFSYGEAILGDLPPGWRAVLEIGIPGPTFKKKGVLWQKQDPRLEGVKLPEGWEEGEDEDGWPYWFKDGNDDDAEWKDPRLSAQELSARGVNIESMLLV